MSIQRLLRIVLCLCVFVAFSGCGSKSKSETPAERFKSEQAGTMTPHGKIVPGSIRDGSDETVLYGTSNGDRWQTREIKNDDGTGTTWAEPEPVGKTQ